MGRNECGDTLTLPSKKLHEEMAVQEQAVGIEITMRPPFHRCIHWDDLRFFRIRLFVRMKQKMKLNGKTSKIKTFADWHNKRWRF